MVYFREVAEPHVAPGQSHKIRYWHLEYYDENALGGMCSPIGVCYICELPGVTTQLQFILVADAWRRQGVGTKLIEAAKERWPDIISTGPMGEEGEELLRKTGLLFEPDCND